MYRRARRRYEGYGPRPQRRSVPQLLNVRSLQEELSEPQQTVVSGRPTSETIPRTTAHARRLQKKNEGSGGGIWRSYHTTATHRDADCRAQHKQYNNNAKVAKVQPLHIGMWSALDLPKQDYEPGRPYIFSSTTEVTPTAAMTQIEKGTWPLGLLPTILPAPRPWLSSGASQLSRSVNKISLMLPISTRPQPPADRGWLCRGNPPTQATTRHKQ